MISTVSKRGSRTSTKLSAAEMEELLQDLAGVLRMVIRRDDLEALYWLIQPEARSTLQAMIQLARDGQKTQTSWTPPPSRSPRAVLAEVELWRTADAVDVLTTVVRYRAFSFSQLEQDFGLSWVSELYTSTWLTDHRIRDFVPQRGQMEKRFILHQMVNQKPYADRGFGLLHIGLRPATLAEAVAYIRERPDILRDRNILFSGSCTKADQGGWYFGLMQQRAGNRHLSVVHASEPVRFGKKACMLYVVT